MFRFGLTNGQAPRSGLILGKDGNLYGTTAGGGPNNAGTIFKVTPTGLFTTLASFDGTNGSALEAGLTLAKNGSLLGTAESGGAKRNYRAVGDGSIGEVGSIGNNGVVFKWDNAGGIQILLHFNNTNGANPHTKVIQGNDGSLYGTTENDGLDNLSTNNPWGHGFGTIYKILPDGSERTLVVFNGTNGGGANALTFDKAGNVFGSTQWGGETYSVTNDPYYGPTIIRGYGTIFRINARGELKTLVQFHGTNGIYPSGLILGRDGNFYGYTSEGGEYNNGTFFQFTPSGHLNIALFLWC